MRTSCMMLVICILFAGTSGCAGSSSGKPVAVQPVFSNGSVVTEGFWISMNPADNHTRGQSFTITGSSSLPAKSIIEVIIVESGPSAAKIKKPDDCITEKQKCVLYFARVTGNTTGIRHWSITTDDSMNLFTPGSQNRYTTLARDTSGDLSVRSEFSMI